MCLHAPSTACDHPTEATFGQSATLLWNDRNSMVLLSFAFKTQKGRHQISGALLLMRTQFLSRRVGTQEFHATPPRHSRRSSHISMDLREFSSSIVQDLRSTFADANIREHNHCLVRVDAGWSRLIRASYTPGAVRNLREFSSALIINRAT